jgi:CIC family chloride channel protein
MAGRMGGGVFPLADAGCADGLAFGWIATGMLPDGQWVWELYAPRRDGAVAAACLAPISTTLIVF